MPARSNPASSSSLNDNDMSIAPPVGAMSSYLARLVSGDTYRSLRDTAKQFRPPAAQGDLRHRRPAEEIRPRILAGGGTMFENSAPQCRADRRPQPRSPLSPSSRTSATRPDGPC